MTNIVLGIRLIPNQFQRIKLENIDLQSKVHTLKDEAAKQTKRQKQYLGL